MSTERMLAAHPSENTIDPAVLAACIDACLACAQTCTACADACLAETNVAELIDCIRTDLDCADVCFATARLLSRQTEGEAAVIRAQVQACLVACRSCAEDCEAHGDHMEHCRLCAQACRRCERACEDVLAALPA
jgi:hypothetical protein